VPVPQALEPELRPERREQKPKVAKKTKKLLMQISKLLMTTKSKNQ
jgi:hypothetical protein